MNYAFLVES